MKKWVILNVDLKKYVSQDTDCYTCSIENAHLFVSQKEAVENIRAEGDEGDLVIPVDVTVTFIGKKGGIK